MKSTLTTFLLAATTIATACWFTESNFNATYIASVNSKYVHYNKVSTISQATYTNGSVVELPISVQIKVSPRFGDQPGESGSKPITAAKLQYKVVKADGTNGSWITVKSLNNPDWDMDFPEPVNLFGRDGIINPTGAQPNDWIVIRVWMTDGMYQTGDLSEDIDIAEIPTTQTEANISIGTTSWCAPHVFKIKISSKKRLII